jgi:hypothetical protein
MRKSNPLRFTGSPKFVFCISQLFYNKRSLQWGVHVIIIPYRQLNLIERLPQHPLISPSSELVTEVVEPRKDEAKVNACLLTFISTQHPSALIHIDIYICAAMVRYLT